MNKYEQDNQIAQFIIQEAQRQESTINLIASENYTDQSIMQTVGSVLTNKYAEGYPGKRYYAGCEIIDRVEQVAIDYCKQLFGAEYANVQPHSGSQANMAVFYALLEPGDKILAMGLDHGGHLTHGYAKNFSGKLYESKHYTVDKQTECLNYDAIEQQAVEFKPKLIIAGASAYSRIIDFERFAHIAKKVDALLLADIAHISGLVAAELHPTPVGHADVITSTTHKTLRGPRGAFIMANKKFGKALDRAIMPGIQGGPFMHVIAAKALAFQYALQPSFKTYQQHVIANAQTLSNELATKGYRIVAGGTDNHLLIIDLTDKNITGKDAEVALQQAGITVSRSTIPYETKSPMLASGIRLGTPAITTRGMQEDQIKEIVSFIDTALSNHSNTEVLHKLKQEIERFCMLFPIRLRRNYGVITP